MTKVLLVEDDLFMSRMYLRVFEHEGFDTVIAENGQVGLLKLKTFHPTIILLDIMMPTMNGIEMLVHLKKDPEVKDIPVIMLTNFADVHMADEAVRLGAVQTIIKSKYSPFDIAEIVKQYTDEKTKGSD